MQKKNDKTTDNWQTSYAGIITLTILATAILGIIFVSFIRDKSEDFFPSKRPKATKHQALQWLEAVKNNQKQEALLIAKKIIPDDDPQMPNPDYLQLLFSLKLGTLILTSPFNDFDFMRWRDAYTVQQIVNAPDIMSEKENFQLEALFRKMQKKIKLISNPIKNYIPSVSISGIWEKKAASTRELCRLFAAIAKQAGYDVQIVALYNKNHILVHLFCEIRKNNRSFVADPRFGFFAADASVALFAGESASLPKVWPKKLAAGLKNRVYKLPAEAVDYKLTNQKLFAKLNVIANKPIPLFGQDPQEEIDAFIRKYQNKTQNTAFTYWTFPFNSLMFSPDFPKKWRQKIRGQKKTKIKK